MSVTAPQGFRASGVTAGLKPSGSPDLALVDAGRPVPAAAVFTTNKVLAAPVRQSKAALADGHLRAVLLNSGGANACTGPAGLADAYAMADAAAAHIGAGPRDVAVASTGLIGVRLPMDLVLPAIGNAAAALTPAGGLQAAEAIRTTDTVAKQAVHRAAGCTIGGMAKGAGMLAPALATMLCVLTTDADLPPDALDRALREAVRRTFDRVDTDGCMSTNDSVYLLASGAAGPVDEHAFAGALTEVCHDLARQLVDDAEGATKRLTVTVANAATETDALDAARAIARSALLKCAVHGEDPNWGRVLAALGTSRAAFDPDRTSVAINGVNVCADGMAAGDLDAARTAMKTREVEIVVTLHAGHESATVLTTDLTAAYVHENSAYST